ncbi:HmuY family protein [Vaginella massiliensis]|uniref:HmuY family protein n=1 Tax=Vaginella massiliensis TaxID=1816680 RepID=UPI0037515371
MPRYFWILPLFTMLLFSACIDDEQPLLEPFVIAFADQSLNYSKIQNEQIINLDFSKPASKSGAVVIEIIEENATYDSDYTTSPKAENLQLRIPYEKNTTSLSFSFTNLIYPFDRADKRVQFKIKNVETAETFSIQGYNTLVISFEASIGATLSPNVGGPNEPNQVYLDLSEEQMFAFRRDQWDLGFYSGDDFRVIINGSIYMATKQLSVTDIDQVTENQVRIFYSEVAVGTFDAQNAAYVDHPSGDLRQTAIATIADEDEENKVYLLNLGYEVGTITPPLGSVAVTGDHRGWMKIRVLKRNGNYLLQYAKVNETTHQEIEISKASATNFSFVNLLTGKMVEAQPESSKWDLCFTVFTTVIDGNGSYGNSDYVIHNRLGGAKVYVVNETNEMTFSNFSRTMIDESKFSEDVRTIGSTWRNVFDGTVVKNKFYVLRDPDGYYYKIRFLNLKSSTGERGYPRLEYQLIP